MNESTTLPRLLAEPLAQACRTLPVVVVTGARQTGKTTLVQKLLLGERSYRTLDDLDVLGQAQTAPDDLIRRSERMTLDEVQRSPDLLLAVKRAVDEEKRPGRYVLTGSANLLLMRQVSESLAGRAIYLTLWPMTRREQLGLGRCGAWNRLLTSKDDQWLDLLRQEGEVGPPEDWRVLARRGGYPTPAHELTDSESRSLWFSGYTRTYLERDLQELSAISALVDFRNLMRAASLRLGQLLNQTELGRDIGLPQPTVHRYLNLLETSYQIVRLPSFSRNRTKRLVKSPKLYWTDTGLALHLAGEPEPVGAHLENLVLADLLAWRDSRFDPPSIMYWRTVLGEEVDFVVECADQLLPIEVKATRRPVVADTRHLVTFRQEYGESCRTGLLLHCGRELEWLSPGVLAVPWWMVI
ncbi:MAG: ATP-binding protein [Bradymonadales bacterium]|nr:ATP-binding protein [Bradymonadales bacterium]